MSRIEILDTTLRDGAQGEGVVFSREDKIKVIRALDDLGVNYIEAGNPASNPKDRALFSFACRAPAPEKRLYRGLTATCRVGREARRTRAAGDLASGARTISFGKASEQVEGVLQCTLEENLRMIRDSVAFCGEWCRSVFRCEHF